MQTGVENAMTRREHDAADEALTATSPRTVVQVTWSLVAGGSEMYALSIAANLDPAAYRSVLCAVDKGGALEPEIDRRGIPRFIMNRRYGIDWGLIWRLYRLFRRVRADIVHTHHFNQLFYSAVGARLAGARLIHTEHSIEYLKRRRLRIALRLLSLLCYRVIAIGEDGARVLREQVGIPSRKLEIIRAGIDTSAFTESKLEARRKLGLGENDRVAVIVARLFPEKNHRLLLAAFADVATRVDRARLLIAGDGTEEEAIRNEITRLGLGESARMLGVRRDVATILAASDVFVLSSDREGLPIAVLEAMAAARPVVASAVGDLPRVIEDGVTGRLFAAGDQAALAKALAEVLSDPEGASRMGLAAREMVAANYGLGAMIEKLEAVYSKGRIR
ncbi:MAG TPA: glycosyltransferase [Blastocatellia bacterium]|nr:glycosyltransferase [Blastocatellia bacterium]